MTSPLLEPPAAHSQQPSVLVIVPTYNESLTIVNALTALGEWAPAVDVLVVDDGSPDGTAAVVRDFAAQARGRTIELMQRSGKLGLGTAYVAGFSWGLERGYQFLVEMDADGSHRAQDLPNLLAAAANADLVIGSRWVAGGEVVNWPWYREMLSRAGNTYARVLLGLRTHDATAGFRIYNTQLLRKIDLTQVSSQGYGFQIDMTVRARQAGAQITEVPIIFVERTAGSSKMDRAIIFEAMVSVARWGAAYRWTQIRKILKRRT